MINRLRCLSNAMLGPPSKHVMCLFKQRNISTTSSRYELRCINPPHDGEGRFSIIVSRYLDYKSAWEITHIHPVARKRIDYYWGANISTFPKIVMYLLFFQWCSCSEYGSGCPFSSFSFLLLSFTSCSFSLFVNGSVKISASRCPIGSSSCRLFSIKCLEWKQTIIFQSILELLLLYLYLSGRILIKDRLLSNEAIMSLNGEIFPRFYYHGTVYYFFNVQVSRLPCYLSYYHWFIFYRFGV